MIEIQTESLLSISDAAKSRPSRPHVSTLWRWINRGVRGVQLETCLIGGRRFTSVEALERFSVATTSAANGKSCDVRTPKHRQRAIEQAEKELAAEDV